MSFLHRGDCFGNFNIQTFKSSLFSYLPGIARNMCSDKTGQALEVNNPPIKPNSTLKKWKLQWFYILDFILYTMDARTEPKFCWSGSVGPGLIYFWPDPLVRNSGPVIFGPDQKLKRKITLGVSMFHLEDKKFKNPDSRK